VAPEEFLRVRWHRTLQDVGLVELAEKLDYLGLTRGIIPKAGGRRLPDLLHRVTPVHEPDEEVGSRREPIRAFGGAILEDVPGLPAVLVAVELSMAPNTGRDPRDPVPGGAKKRSSHRFSSRKAFESSKVRRFGTDSY
jgi:hypothetical protein